MSNQTVVINLPEDIYNKYKLRATQNRHSVEAEITFSLLKVAPTGELPQTDLENLVAQLAFFDDIALQHLAQSLYPEREAVRIQYLHSEKETEGLDETETGEMAELVKEAAQMFRFWLISRNEALRKMLEQNQNKR